MSQFNESFHKACEDFRKKIHVVLVRPEYGGNIGSIARALENMGLLGDLRIVSSKERIEWSEVRKMSKHAFERASQALFYPSLKEALLFPQSSQTLSLAATARSGSPHRPHPLPVRVAVEKSIHKLKTNEISDLVLVFGPESDGLKNEEVDLCDWVVTIPSYHHYRSLNLAQAVLVFAHEANQNLLEPLGAEIKYEPGQREKMIQHVLSIAEESGFILEGDPFKMRPRLEEILGLLPKHLPFASTLHGLLDQISRSMKKGMPDIRGRFKHFSEGGTNG